MTGFLTWTGHRVRSGVLTATTSVTVSTGAAPGTGGLTTTRTVERTRSTGAETGTGCLTTTSRSKSRRLAGTSLMKKMIMPGNKGILFADSGGGAHKMCFESGCLGKYSYHEEDR